MAGSITAYGDGNGTTYSSISPRTTAYVVKDLLERGAPFLVFEKFGQAKPIPEKHSQVIKFRRYFLNFGTFSFGSGSDDVYNPAQYYASTGANGLFTVGAGITGRKVLTEGVTPNPTKLDSEDISATLVQYGDYVTISDVILDTHEDPVLQEAVAIVGEQAAYMVELIRYGVLAASTNLFYAGTATAIGEVAEKMTLTLQRKITRALKRQLAKPITSVVRSTANYGTEAIAPAYIAVAHPDCESDIRDMTGFVPAEKYGTMSPMEGEIGKVEDVRYITSTVVQVSADSGALTGTTGLTSSGTKVDVYPIIFLGKDAYGLVPLKGKHAITPMVHNPQVSDSDPLAQRGHVGWKTWQTAVILNPAWMAVAKVGVTAL